MIRLDEKQIKEIASDLEMGMKCYYHEKTGEIKVVPDFDSMLYADDELWEDDLKALEENWTDYQVFENMTSSDSFSVMAAFTEMVEEPLKGKLTSALNRPKPFRNFKWIIDNSGEYRQKWFDFKSEKFVEWVKDQIEGFNGFQDKE